MTRDGGCKVCGGALVQVMAAVVGNFVADKGGGCHGDGRRGEN